MGFKWVYSDMVDISPLLGFVEGVWGDGGGAIKDV